ncbi:uncharacterized protein LOC142563907 [Dermacentor variabilis]|uniref:uncharacterized protein LOC142563907 n=1 Tax=Dermacentor variabilis TaxID=34621 RepID=UPI003F5B074C
MINITVGKVKKLSNNDVRVLVKGTNNTLDGPLTLEALADSQKIKINRSGIVYLFTRSHMQRDAKKNDGTDEVPYTIFYIETKESFCSDNVSAAVVTYEDGENSHDFPGRSMARIFGANNYMTFSKSDRQTMNETFSRCGKHTESRRR